MKLDRPVKLLVGGGTVWIILYPLLFVVIWLSTVAGVVFSEPVQSPFSLFSAFDLIFPVHCLTAILQFALIGFYLFHIIKNTQASDAVRVIFGVGMFFMSILAMPIYYYFFIWRDSFPEWALAKEGKPTSNSNNNEILINSSTPPKPSKTSKKSLLIIGGVIGTFILLLFGSVFIFSLLINKFNQRMQEQIFSIPTPVQHENLSIYPADQKAFYQPVETSSFTPINTFKEIYTWSNYNQVPLLVNDDDIFIAGYLEELDNSWGSGINVAVISADINTGKVNWQAVAGSALLLKDSQRIYAEAPNAFGAAGITAYDINTGNLVWETHFDYAYAVGIGHLTLTETDLVAETYYQGDNAIYTVDVETGEIKDVVKNTPRYADDEVVIYNGMRFEKQGYGVPDKVTATRIDDGSIIWEYDDEPVISNIAVGGAITYFLTEKNRLIALDTNTGEVIEFLAFAPRFSHDFDFVNMSIIVAADGDVVAVYYEDSQQLSVFRFTEPAR
jgi:outer membrane protein assembly factor BamB